MTPTMTPDVLPRGINETDADYARRLSIVTARRHALARGLLRATCVTCAARHVPAEVPTSDSPYVRCPECGERDAMLWIVAIPAQRTPRSTPDECTDLRCTTSESRTCRCACLGIHHGTDSR